LIEAFGVKPEEVEIEQVKLEKPITEILAEVEQKLAELPVETLSKCLAFASRIDQLIEAFGVKPEEVEIEQVKLEKPITEIIAEVEHGLSEIEKTTETTGLTDSYSLMQKMRTLAIRDKIDLGRKLFGLRNSVTESERLFVNRLLALKNLVGAVGESIGIETELEEIRKTLLTLRKTVEKEKSIAREEEKFVKSAKTIYFEAWVPEFNVKKATDRISKATDGNSIIVDEPPAQDEKLPIIFKPVPNYIRAFEKLVYAFGYPDYGDINPIRLLAITFPILFGIMFADVGQGAIFVIIGAILTLLRRRVKMEEAGDIIQYLLISAEMFIFLGTSAIFFGFLFGEFFGPSGVIHPISLGRIGPFYIGGFEPTHEPMRTLRFAILVGAIHTSLGLVLRFINEVRHKHYKLAPIPICWLWLLWGSLSMWVYWGGISQLSRWFAEGNLMLAGLIILPLVLILGVTAKAEGFMEGVGFTVEVFAETLSHSMSYGRLMALGLIHSAMNYMFLVLGGVEHGHFPLESIPIIATGTILVMIIEGLVVFVHTLRLHWVEWFSKFHSGEGIPFKPFKATQ
jgi:V/A-type H+-transporting ATPase subunit I